MYDVIDGARVGVLTTGATATDLNEVRRHFRSVVSLIPRPDTRERETVIAAGLAYAHVDVTALTPAAADRVVAAVDGMRGPVLLECASEEQAQAAVGIFMAKTRGWTAAETVTWARLQGQKWPQSPALAAWVAAATEQQPPSKALPACDGGDGCGSCSSGSAAAAAGVGVGKAPAGVAAS